MSGHLQKMNYQAIRQAPCRCKMKQRKDRDRTEQDHGKFDYILEAISDGLQDCQTLTQGEKGGLTGAEGVEQRTRHTHLEAMKTEIAKLVCMRIDTGCHLNLFYHLISAEVQRLLS